MKNRHIDATSFLDTVINKNGPLIGFLYDENKVDILRGDGYLINQSLVISQWSDSISINEGYILFMPYSNFVVVGKYGETLILFKNYINVGKNDRALETALSSIISIIHSPEHKIITVSDSNILAMIQFLVPEIGCGYDPLIMSCSKLYLNDDIECVKNAVWNMVDKKCFCQGGYYLNINTRTCDKCQCREATNYCQNSATDCYEDSYLDINFKKAYDFTAQGCWLGEEIQPGESESRYSSHLMTVDGDNYALYDIDLRNKSVKQEIFSKTLSIDIKRNQKGLKCMDSADYYSYDFAKTIN